MVVKAAAKACRGQRAREGLSVKGGNGHCATGKPDAGLCRTEKAYQGEAQQSMASTVQTHAVFMERPFSGVNNGTACAAAMRAADVLPVPVTPLQNST